MIPKFRTLTLTRTLPAVWFCLAWILATGPAGHAQADQQVQESVVYEIAAIPYTAEDGSVSIELEGTYRLPDASGEAKVERKTGLTEIEVELDEMKPAQAFGGDYNTYVLWVGSPEGQIDNVGEFRLEGNRSKLNVSTRLDVFGMFVTAEPHFLVDSPSRFVVLENTRTIDEVRGELRVTRIQYLPYQGVYPHRQETLVNADEADDEVYTALDQARTAVRLAQQSPAPRLAPAELRDAELALERAIGVSEAEDASQSEIESRANDAVRSAVRAQRLAEERSFQEALSAERAARAREIEELENRIDAATTQAEIAQLRLERSQLQLEIEQQARAQATRLANQAQQQAEQERAERVQSEVEAERAQRAAEIARTEAERARQEAERARVEREAAFDQMRRALSEVAETRQTARGLIVNIPDVLFDFDRATLRPEGRERLSRISGVLVATEPEFDLIIEGHTDNVGSEEYNQDLSERRAQTVEQYLLSNQVPAGLIEEVRGAGENEPLASNETEEGRQRNRRVEILIETDAFESASNE